jgi:hypothetical protein
VVQPGFAVACSDHSGMAARPWQTYWPRHPGVRSGDQLSIGEQAADRMGDTMSSWPFVFAFFGLMIAWAVVNSAFYLGTHGRHGFDHIRTSC